MDFEVEDDSGSNVGYPTDETLEAIKLWEPRDLQGLMDFIGNYFCHYGRITEKNFTDEFSQETFPIFELATGGWSGNESIIQYMKLNFCLWALHWESSHRGGLFRFRKPINHGTGTT